MTATAPAVAPALDLDRRYALSPRVEVRPEPFGALLYHFGTRRLSFLKDRRLLDVVRGLAEQPTARAACEAAGVTAEQLPAYARALSTLVGTDMIREVSP